MTVADLIAKLKEIPQDAVVIVWDAYGCLHTPEGVSKGKTILLCGDYATEAEDETIAEVSVKIN